MRMLGSNFLFVRSVTLTSLLLYEGDHDRRYSECRRDYCWSEQLQQPLFTLSSSQWDSDR